MITIEAMEEIRQQTKKLSKEIIQYLLGKDTVFEIYDDKGNLKVRRNTIERERETLM
jgi:hypothetical protein